MHFIEEPVEVVLLEGLIASNNCIQLVCTGFEGRLFLNDFLEVVDFK